MQLDRRQILRHRVDMPCILRRIGFRISPSALTHLQILPASCSSYSGPFLGFSSAALRRWRLSIRNLISQARGKDLAERMQGDPTNVLGSYSYSSLYSVWECFPWTYCTVWFRNFLYNGWERPISVCESFEEQDALTRSSRNSIAKRTCEPQRRILFWRSRLLKTWRNLFSGFSPGWTRKWMIQHRFLFGPSYHVIGSQPIFGYGK